MTEKKKLPILFVAADGSSEDKVMAKIEQVDGVPGDFGIKINLDAVYGNIGIVKRVKKTTKRALFVDNKIYNGKRTMAEIVQQLADLGVEMTNAYAHADTLLERAVKIANDYLMTFLGVTVLTHHTDDYCREVYRRSIGEAVKMLADMALKNGCHGIILPGPTLANVSELQCIKFNPAVRPDWYKDPKANDQEQIMDHRQAIKDGATIISCGSPIFKSPDPAAALGRILEEIGV